MVANLRRLRINRSISQQKLADEVGTTQQAINRYENHDTEPDIYMLTQLADYFGTSIDFLVGHMPQLMGEKIEEDLKLSKEEMQLIQSYRRLTKDEKASIRYVIKNYLSGEEMEEEA